ncbi:MULTISPECIES: MurR/RpiR family transcriptional regulator [Roseobacteraceae]|uniref:Helix-turn-helix domain, rpiR family n=1 Tax=Pseudosulfitobacter pseudonitzschiae TaxID=1402135 RepID=A0A221K683_9RHOB|nr:MULTISPECIES: MurR/RpiR family transcriptional regulator [Roseobacteraceae]ASM74508.1 helix-turn-helix domain, rpiR family [Pseudosulfitobacter pseudonitzschiae]
MKNPDHISISVQQLLAASVEGATKGEKAIASYMMTNIKTLPFETAATVAAKIGVSEASVGRYCRNIGLDSFKGLKSRLQADLGDSAWLIGDRLRDFHARSRSGEAELSRALELEIAALVTVYEMAADKQFEAMVKRLARCPQVFVAGFQTERGHAEFLAHGLQYLRPGIWLADQAGGTFSEVLQGDPAQSCLVIIDGRKYSSMAEKLARAARERGVKVTLITDLYCNWGAGLAEEIFAVPTDLNLFWDNTAAMSSLISLTVNGVFNELGADVEERMAAISAGYNGFVGHIGAPSDTSIK